MTWHLPAVIQPWHSHTFWLEAVHIHIHVCVLTTPLKVQTLFSSKSVKSLPGKVRSSCLNQSWIWFQKMWFTLFIVSCTFMCKIVDLRYRTSTIQLIWGNKFRQRFSLYSLRSLTFCWNCLSYKRLYTVAVHH